MTNTAIILAGGVGQRVGSDIPKQFIEVCGAPVIVHTLSIFQRSKDIDRIVIVCVDGWKEEVESYSERFNITKLFRVVKGGKNSMESIFNGLIGSESEPDDIVIIHDSVRPLITKEIVKDCIEKCIKYGNGCASIPLQETIVCTDDRLCGKVNIDRSKIMRVQTPQAYRYYDIENTYLEAKKRGVDDSVYANTLFMEFGGTIYFSLGSPYNIKITTKKDLFLFELLFNSNRLDST